MIRKQEKTRMYRPIFLVAVFCFLAVFAPASEKFRPDPLEVFEGRDAGPWERVERLTDLHPGFRQEAFCEAGKQKDPLIVKWFGGKDAPHSGQFLLHCAKGFSGKSFPNPVLLIQGAGDNANRAWIHPYDAVMPETLSHDKQGFALNFANLGFSVFAVTFSHNQGDNFMQAEQVANAIQRIRILLNRTADPKFQVDVIAHSKGNVAVRLYCSDGRTLFPKKTFLTNYRNDIRRFIAIASPMRGIDSAFRYYGYNLTLASKGEANAPFGAEKMLVYGLWKNLSEYSMFSDSKNYFPGQSQILYNLVRDAGLPLGLESATTDMNLTAEALYHGGKSLFLTSQGIDKAIKDGESLIYKLEERGIDPRITLGVIAGNNPFLSCHVSGLGYIPMPHEIVSAPFDGLLFVDSAAYTDGILRRGAKLLGKKILNLNHLRLAMYPEAFKVIDEWLLQKTGNETHAALESPESRERQTPGQDFRLPESFFRDLQEELSN